MKVKLLEGLLQEITLLTIKKNMAFGYINSDLELNLFIGKSLEIEVEKIKYESSIEIQPLHDPENKLLKG